MAAKRDQGPGNNPGSNPGVVLVPQPHGGALKRGGNNPGGGAPPSALRETARLMLADKLQVLEDIAGREDAKDRDKIAAVRELARIGMGSSMAMVEVRQKLDATVAMLRALLPPEHGDNAIIELRRIWLGR